MTEYTKEGGKSTRKAEIKGKTFRVAIVVLMAGLMLGSPVNIPRPASTRLTLSDSAQVYLNPQDSSTELCNLVDVEVWINATEFQAGQIRLIYNSTCADATNWVRNTTHFPLGTWESDTSGEEWVTFTAISPISGNYLIGTLTMHGLCEAADCSTPLDFVDPSKLFNQSGNEVAVNWVDGTFRCEFHIQPSWKVPIVANAGPEGMNADLEFGIHPDATDGYDSGIDLPSPPPQPGALFEAYYSIIDPLFPRLNKDFWGETSNAWTLEARSTYEDIELSWNTDDVPLRTALRLVSAEADIDMKSVSSVTLPPGAHTITIIAEQIEIGQHDLTISSTSGGSVTVPGEGTFSYDAGTTVDMVAEAEEGHQFVNWTGDIDTIGDIDAAETTIAIDTTKNITANFALLSYNLTTDSTDGGSVTDPGEDTFTYACGDVIDLIVEADEGYRFVGWTGDVDTIARMSATTTNITMHGNYSITANFDWIPPPVNWSLIGGIIAAVLATGLGIIFFRRGRVA